MYVLIEKIFLPFIIYAKKVKHNNLNIIQLGKDV